MNYNAWSTLSTDDKLASGDCGHALTSVRRAGIKVPTDAWKAIDERGDIDGYIAAVGTGTPEQDFAVQLANHVRSNNIRIPRTKHGAKHRSPRKTADTAPTAAPIQFGQFMPERTGDQILAA